MEGRGAVQGNCESGCFWQSAWPMMSTGCSASMQICRAWAFAVDALFADGAAHILCMGSGGGAIRPAPTQELLLPTLGEATDNTAVYVGVICIKQYVPTGKASGASDAQIQKPDRCQLCAPRAACIVPGIHAPGTGAPDLSLTECLDSFLSSSHACR